MELRFGIRGWFSAFSFLAVLLLIPSCDQGGVAGGGSSGGAYFTPSTPRSWGTPELIETSNYGFYSRNSQIAMDGHGNAVAVWSEEGEAGYSIWSNHFNGSTWANAELIETDDVGDADEPQIAMYGYGKAIAVWQRLDGFRWNIWANRFDGSSWGTAELLEMSDATAGDPQIATDGSGNAIAVWDQADVAGGDLRASRFDGFSWGTPESIETNDTGSTADPQIAMDSTGTAVAVWIQADGFRWNIWANRFDGSSWGTAELIETGDATASDPQIAMDGAGNAVAVWIQSDGTAFSVWANHFDGSAWGTAAMIETDDTVYLEYPQIAMNDSGDAVAVWEQHAGGSQVNIWANHFDGSTWGTAERIENSNNRTINPQIAMDGAGNAIAVWEEQIEVGHRNVWANHFDGSAWGSARLIEHTSFSAYKPQIAMEYDGSAIAVWEQADNYFDEIWANRFD